MSKKGPTMPKDEIYEYAKSVKAQIMKATIIESEDIPNVSADAQMLTKITILAVACDEILRAVQDLNDKLAPKVQQAVETAKEEEMENKEWN